jgi:hypothetical protein
MSFEDTMDELNAAKNRRYGGDPETPIDRKPWDCECGGQSMVVCPEDYRYSEIARETRKCLKCGNSFHYYP